MLNNYHGKAGDTVTALQGIKDRVGPDTEVDIAVGGLVVNPSSRDGPFDQAAELQKAVELARRSDVALVFVGTDRPVEQEGRDRKTLGLTGNQEELAEAVFATNPRTVLVEMSAGPLTVPKLTIWDETTHGFVVEPGAFDIMVGTSSADVRLKDRIEVTRSRV